MRRKRMWWWIIGIGICVVVLAVLFFPVFSQARERARVYADAYAPLEGRTAGSVAAEGQMKLAQAPMAGSREAMGVPPVSQDYDEAAKVASPKPGTLATEAANHPDRYLIRNATLTIETKNARAAADTLLAEVKAGEGYVLSMNESVDGLGARTIVAAVRIPAAMFDSFSQSADHLGKVLSKQVTAEDVTEEFVDSQSRLRNLKRTEDRLLEHLSKTGKLSDTLLVEKELTRVRADIEQLEGRLRFLKNRVDYSTITVTLQEAARQQPLTDPETFSSGKVFSDAVRSLVGFAQNLWSIAIWLAIWAAVWLPILLVALFVVRRVRRALSGDSAVPPGSA